MNCLILSSFLYSSEKKSSIKFKNDINNAKINFLYNNCLIRFDYDMKISEFFQNDNNPKIIIDVPGNLIGKKIKVTFKTNHDSIQEIFTHTGKTIENLIMTNSIILFKNSSFIAIISDLPLNKNKYSSSLLVLKVISINLSIKFSES